MNIRSRVRTVMAVCGIAAATALLAYSSRETALGQEKPHNNVRKAKEGNGGVPTVDQANTFLDDAEKRLFDLGVKQSRASWVQANFIQFGTEAMAPDSGKPLTTMRMS